MTSGEGIASRREIAEMTMADVEITEEEAERRWANSECDRDRGQGGGR